MSDVTPSQTRATSHPGYTVAAVARRLGVAPATLRTWDRRYGVGPTDHETGTRRRYGPHDLTRLEVMRRLTLDGVAPADAARVALASVPRHPENAADSTGPGVSTGPENPDNSLHQPHPLSTIYPANGSHSVHVLHSGHVAATAAAPPRPSGLDRAGAFERLRPRLSVPYAAGPAGVPPPANGSGGRVLSLPGASPAARGLGRAAMALDTVAVRGIVTRALDLQGVVVTWDTLLRPVLAAAGRRWETTGDGVEIEHVLTECVHAALRAYADGMYVAERRPVLLACGPGESHSLPLYAVAAGLAERGTPSRILGAAVPRTALHNAVVRTGPAAVLVLALSRAAADVRGVGSMPATRPPTDVVAAGPGWRGMQLPRRASYVCSLPEALEALA
jgi:MerR family transcriptional regulator, light-induced transcriptional regulator